ncbi:MAG: DUF1501 domain-containing protein [Pirellulales bacterium]
MFGQVHRRRFLELGAFGLQFGLADLLRARAAGSSASARSGKSAILVYLPGGPSQLDSFDPKPAAPAEIRGEFASVQTSVPGVRFCEHLPRLAARCDRLGVLRAVTGMVSEDHNDLTVMTGYPNVTARLEERPSLGAVVSHARGTANGLPPFVSLRGTTIGCQPGFLGPSHQPFVPGGPAEADLKRPKGLSVERFQERSTLLRSLDRLRRDVDARGELAAMDEFQRQAFDLVTSGKVRAALNGSREPAAGQRRYAGVEQFLKARRLVEAGVGCVTLSVGEWDGHQNNFANLKQTLPALDRGLATLLEDLEERGLAEEVVVLCWGEFGRTPKINAAAGRDHWTPVMSAVIAGGGLQPGVIGRTNAWGERAEEGASTVQQVLATVYRAVGIDPSSKLVNAAGRPLALLDECTPIAGL